MRIINSARSGSGDSMLYQVEVEMSAFIGASTVAYQEILREMVETIAAKILKDEGEKIIGEIKTPRFREMLYQSVEKRITEQVVEKLDIKIKEEEK